jgi:sarcosine oxidase subunit alpha
VRLPNAGSRIDRSRHVRFTFDGREIDGFAGDTIASALLANDVRIVGRGIYTGRPRGVFTAGSEEPNAVVQVEWPDGASEPMLRATVVEVEEGMRVRSLAGRGRLETTDDPGRFDKRYRHVEVLVVGAGEAGRRAAREAAAAEPGDRVLLVDERPLIEPIDGVEALPGSTATGIHDHGFVVVAQGRRLHHVRARRIVLATGALERPIVFADNDRPGVMLASAARAYAERYGVLVGRRAVVFTTNDSVEVPDGIEVVELVDARRGGRVTGTEADADGVLAGVLVDGRPVKADLLLVSGGWNPNVALWSQARGTLRYDDELNAYVPDRAFGRVEIAGSAAGTGLPRSAPIWLVEPDGGDGASHFVDLERDATLADLRRAVGAGLTSIEHIKRYTTIGTASDQGKSSGVVSSAIAAALLGQEAGGLGVPTFRPPYVPLPFALLAGRDRGALHDPVRTTSIHPWHVANDAVFEDVGQWKRPWYFPRTGESMDDAVLRECRAAREAVAAMDASTLGKIDVQGPDAAEFLDRVYTNVFSTLAVGSCRYGVMCRADGMVFDDGVTSRLANDRFHMTTTTGNAAAVMDWLEEWLQTEWPELRVSCTSVTEQWATVAVVGPRSRDVLAALAPSLDVSREAFPFMTWRDAEVAGTPARVFRISFSGELAYEINVPSWNGLALWEAVMAAGEPFAITPYGTETMHVLRAEKGYAIVGQETDGTVTPQDLGMDWIVSKRKPFIGSRSHRRADTARTGRKELVGLLPVDPGERLPEGAQLVDDPGIAPPVPMVGHVTSSYRSAALGRTFALALVRSGRERIGERVFAPLEDRVVEAEIASPILFDPENARRDGEPEAVA